MNRSQLVWVVAAVSLSAGTAHADFQEDLAQEYRDSDFIRGAIVEKLITLKLGKACQEKVLDKGNMAFNIIGRSADSLIGYAKAVTGDDWKEMAKSSANTEEENRKAVEEKIAAMKSKLHLTVNVEGSNCDASGNGLWLKYLSDVAGTLAKHPPKSGKAIVTVNVTTKAKDFAVKTNKDGSTFEITGPLDKEVAGWSDKLEKHVTRVAKQ
jgi:hypothetical protein